jgi:glycerol uptake facilitator-like aquaporin
MTEDENADRSYSANSDEESYDDGNEEVDRDEVKEVRKVSSKDTTRIRFWRFVVTVVLLLTAFAVTVATYTFLAQQELENFVTAVGNMLLYIICHLSIVNVSQISLNQTSLEFKV